MYPLCKFQPVRKSRSAKDVTVRINSTASVPLVPPPAPDYSPAVVCDVPLDENDAELSIQLNVAGKPFRLLKRNLLRHAEPTLLRTFALSEHERRLAVCDGFDADSNAYYFDRDPVVFGAVAQFYRSGALHCTTPCGHPFVDELRFWQLPTSLLAPCCRERLDWDAPTETTDGAASAAGAVASAEELFDGKALGKYRLAVWRLIEDPTSGRLAKVYSLASAGLVVLSVVTLILASLPELQVEVTDEEGKGEEREPHAVLRALELACIAVFTVEYCVRLLVTVDRCQFVRVPLNVVDVLSIAPYYAELALQLAGFNSRRLGNFKGMLLTMRILRVLRVLRIFKLARYSGGISSLGSTLTESYREIGMLLSFMSITIILYSTAVYYMEQEIEGSDFVSIPATFWWCLVTMTTVGYGDMVPETIGGKVVATFASISGVIVLAFPITLIVENFNRQYRGGTKSSHHRPSTFRGV